MFDYRWHNFLHFFWNNLQAFVYPIQQLLLNEHEEVITVVNHLKEKKKQKNGHEYKEVVALCECYSTFTFAEAQFEEQERERRLFTKLIFDSCWFSFKEFAKSLSRDPWIPINPQTGGCPQCIKTFLQKSYVRKPLLSLIFLWLPEVTIEKYLHGITNTPILFIHGNNDVMVPFSTFEQIWNATHTEEKTLLLTPYWHSDNVGKAKDIYCTCCRVFIESSNQKEFLKLLKSTHNLSQR